MFLLVGLGNPGAKYEGNRHNIGFMAMDAIARRNSFGPWRAKFQGEIAEGKLGGEKVYLLKPQTYMNNSGQSVGEAARFYKIGLDQITVFHDELDLPPGKLRVKTGGGHGGHNGLRDIDAHLGKAYHRVRMGIGHPGDKERVHGHVLSDFAKSEHQNWLDRQLDEIADHADLLAKGDQAGFMNKIALALNPPKPKKPKQPKQTEDMKPAAPIAAAQPDSTQTALSLALGAALNKGKE